MDKHDYDIYAAQLANRTIFQFTEEELARYVQQRIQEAMSAPSTPNDEEAAYQAETSRPKDNSAAAQHVYHHYDNDGPRVAMKVERNTKGYNWEVSVSGAKSVEEAVQLLKQGNDELKTAYGESR